MREQRKFTNEFKLEPLLGGWVSSVTTIAFALLRYCDR